MKPIRLLAAIAACVLLLFCASAKAEMAYDIVFADQADFNGQMTTCADAGKFAGLIARYSGSDDAFNATKFGVIVSRWFDEYENVYGLIGYTISDITEGDTFRYMLSFSLKSDDESPADYDGVVGDFAYNEADDGMMIARYLGADANVFVPEMINGRPVTHIGGNAFTGNSALVSISLPATLTSIDDGYYDSVFGGYYAPFSDCTALESIVMPDSVTHIGRYAFYKCTALADVTLNEGLVFLGESAFDGCAALEELALPETLTTISQNALANTGITQLYFPAAVSSALLGTMPCLEAIEVDPESMAYLSHEGVLFEKARFQLICYPPAKADTAYVFPDGSKRIDFSAFFGVRALKEITLPASVERIYGSNSYTPMERIDIAADNPNYVSLDGVVYTKEMDTLVCFPRAKKVEQYVMPDSVTGMETGALCWLDHVRRIEFSKNLAWCSAISNCASLEEVIFPAGCSVLGFEEGTMMDCRALKSVVLPDGPTELPLNMFFGCTALESVALPDTLEVIGVQAFAYCESIDQITIPPAVTTIGSSAFFCCFELNTVYMSAVPAYYESYPFSRRNIVIASENPALEAFAQEHGYTFVLLKCQHGNTTPATVPATTEKDGVRGALVCLNCGQKTEERHVSRAHVLEIPASVTGIEAEAFLGVAAQQAIIPDGVTAIGSRAFAQCDALYLVAIPDSVTDIAVDAFEGSTDTAIFCAEGSAAQAYAVSCGMMYMLK